MSDDLTQLDYTIISWLFESRAATGRQLGDFLNSCPSSTILQHLNSLLESGYIRKRELLLGGEVVYSLSRKGCDTGVDAGVISPGELSPTQLWRRLEVSDMTLLHELEVVDVRIALERNGLATVRTYLSQQRFVTHAGKRIFPDGVVTLRNDRESRFCLEVDRGTEPLKKIATKVADYSTLIESALKQPFRLLFVVPSIERRNNIAWLLLKEFPKVPNFCLIATHSDVIDDPFGDVFLAPGALRCVPGLDQFAPTLGERNTPYRRSLSRDTLIEAEARLVRIIT